MTFTKMASYTIQQSCSGFVFVLRFFENAAGVIVAVNGDRYR